MATFFIAVFVLLMQFLWKNIDDLVGKGLEWMVILKLLFYVSASLVPMALPLAVLLSSLMTFGNLGEQSELVAFKSAGISLKRVLRPLAVVVIFISFTAFLFSNYWLPHAHLKSKSLLYDVREQKPTLDLKAGYFSSELDGFTIRVKSKKTIDKVEHLYDVLIYDHSKDLGNKVVISAKEGIMTVTKDKRFIELKLFNGVRYTEEREKRTDRKYPHSRLHFEENLIRFDLEQFQLNRTEEELFKSDYRMLNMAQLNKAIDTLITIRKEKLDKEMTEIKKSLLIYTELKEEHQGSQTRLVDIDSLLEQLSSTQKRQIYNTAANMSRNAKVRLKRIDKDYKLRTRYLNKHRITWHKKLSFSFACFVLFLIGAPFGAIVKKGGLGMPIVIAVIFFIVFYMLSISGEQMVKEGAIAAEYGIWMSSAVLLPIGIFLTYKATTDAPLLQWEGIKGLFKFKKRHKGS